MERDLMGYIQGNQGSETPGESSGDSDQQLLQQVQAERIEGEQPQVDQQVQGEGQSPAATNAASLPPTDPAQEPTTQPVDQSMVAEIQRQLIAMQSDRDEHARAIRHQQAENARLQEQMIISQINAIPDEQERANRFAAFQHAKSQAIIAAQARELSERDQRDEANRQEQAKAAVVLFRAQAAGIPMELLPILRQSRDDDELKANIATIQRVIGQRQVQQKEENRQEIVDSGVYVAGGDQSGFVPPKEPKMRSGDLRALIAARPHQIQQR